MKDESLLVNIIGIMMLFAIFLLVSNPAYYLLGAGLSFIMYKYNTK